MKDHKYYQLLLLVNTASYWGLMNFGKSEYISGTSVKTQFVKDVALFGIAISLIGWMATYKKEA